MKWVAVFLSIHCFRGILIVICACGRGVKRWRPGREVGREVGVVNYERKKSCGGVNDRPSYHAINKQHSCTCLNTTRQRSASTTFARCWTNGSTLGERYTRSKWFSRSPRMLSAWAIGWWIYIGITISHVLMNDSLMNDRFGKGKGADRKKVTSAGIQRINHATGETASTPRASMA